MSRLSKHGMCVLKDVLLHSDNELLMYEVPKKMGFTDFVSETKSVENYPDFAKLVHVIQHGLQGSMVKNYQS